MPCKKGMVGCKDSCLHRGMVFDYRTARHAQEMQQEARTVQGRGELELEAENGVRLITFKQWLLGQRHEPDPTDGWAESLAQSVYESW